ncbi:hypothetical protein GJ699_01150 [Duganella sp. FT80W]|uniref:Uncharacterized protein n=1 Tax=Duganella guangzhouensis TaxID=2666084 RepID=A0A6I2KU60_9BURK|nr:hypothetical protein [Duganella guangzhouensis]MRW88587.1 hypothetical protein [Duganella guangzhouensis]
MATVKVTLTFSASSATLRFVAYVDDTPLTIVNGKASPAPTLEQGVEHVVSWYVWGNGGDTLTITANNGSKDILNKSSAIPASKTKSAGFARIKP